MISELRAAIAANLDGMTTLGGDTVQVNPYLPTNPTPPAAAVLPGDDPFVTYHQRFAAGTASGDEYSFDVELIVAGAADDESAQAQLDNLIDQAKAKIESDRRLGGLCSACWVVSVSDYGPGFVGGAGAQVAVVGARLNLKLQAR